MSEVSQRLVNSPIGILYLNSSEEGLRELHLGASDKVKANIVGSKKSEKQIEISEELLKKYFSSNSQAIEELPIDWNFLRNNYSAFELSIWRALRRIPAGKTKSYKQLATSAKRPNSSRPAGSACGKNPILLGIPCHRAITSSGKLGGFAAGVKTKEQLLQLEAEYFSS